MPGIYLDNILAIQIGGEKYIISKFDPECQHLKRQYHRIFTQLQNFHYYKKPHVHEYYYYYYYY